MKYIFAVIPVVFLSYSYSFAQSDNHQNWNAELLSIVKDKGAKAVVFISSEDCISCTNYVQSGLKDMPVLYASNKSVFYDYCSEMGINIPENKIIKDKNILNALLNTFHISKILIPKNDTFEVLSLNDDAINILRKDSIDEEEIKSIFIPATEDMDIDNFKESIPIYKLNSNSYGIIDPHYNFYYEFNSPSDYKKTFITLDESLQNDFYSKIAKALNLDSTIIYAKKHSDSANTLEADFILKRMGQAKVSVLNANDKYYLSYVNYCTFDKPHDSSHVSITKATVLSLRKEKEFGNLLKVFDKLVLESKTYYPRPYNVKIQDKYLIMPYVSTSPEGIPDTMSHISLAVFLLSDTNIYSKPNMFFHTNLRYDNFNNIRFDLIDNRIIVFDNKNKLIHIYSEDPRQNKNITNSYQNLSIRFVYDINSNNSDTNIMLLNNNNNNEACLSTIYIYLDKIKTIKIQNIVKTFLDAAFFNFSKVNAYKIEIEKNGITFFNN